MITPFRSLVLCGENRQDMDDWLGALKNATENQPQNDAGAAEMLGGNHQWYATSHARPTYCNVCRDALYGKNFLLLFLSSIFLFCVQKIFIIFILQELLRMV